MLPHLSLPINQSSTLTCNTTEGPDWEACTPSETVSEFIGKFADIAKEQLDSWTTATADRSKMLMHKQSFRNFTHKQGQPSTMACVTMPASMDDSKVPCLCLAVIALGVDPNKHLHLDYS